MKFCPFLVAGQSLQASQPRAGAIPGSQTLILPTPEPRAPAGDGSITGSTWADFGAGAGTVDASWTEPANGLRFGFEDDVKVGTESAGEIGRAHV